MSTEGRSGGAKTGGRQKGVPNKATAEIKELARKYAPECMVELVRLAKEAVSEQARVAAIKEIFDRAYGKSTQPLTNDPEAGALIVKIIKPGASE